MGTVYPKKYAHVFCFAVFCCSYKLTDFPISIRLTSLALWQSNDCPSASKATLLNMDKYFMWIHYERLHNHNKAQHNKTVCIFLEIYCNCILRSRLWHVITYLCPHNKRFRLKPPQLTHPSTLCKPQFLRNQHDMNSHVACHSQLTCYKNYEAFNRIPHYDNSGQRSLNMNFRYHCPKTCNIYYIWFLV